MKASKKSILTTGLAVALAAATLIGGGTYAYLKGETDPVVNTFSTNEVQVELNETTGREYNILPGTTQKKDPKVTVTNTVDAYVYVIVDDKTEGLVDYTIDAGWTPLDGVAHVYYREVAADAEEKEFSVLKDDTVTYSAALENSNMLNEDGTLKEDVTLTFTAYAVQKEPFGSDAVAAYFRTENVVKVSDTSTVADINQKIDEAAGPVVVMVTEDTLFNESIVVPEKKEVILYLDDGVTLTNTDKHTVQVDKLGNLTVKGGTMDATAHGTAAVYNEGGTVVLDNVTLLRSEEAGTSSSDNGGNSYYVILNHGDMILNNCTVEANGKYSSLIENGWQNGNQNTDGKESKLTINGGTYTGGINTVKNDDYGYLTINGGVFKNVEQYAVMNWNVATINDGTFITKKVVLFNGYSDEAMDQGLLTITGGDFQWDTSYYGISTEGNGGSISVSGGTFASRFIGQGSYLADGYTVLPNEDGTWTVVPASTGD